MLVTHIGRILQGRLNHGLAEKNIAPAGAPQHPLEGRQTLPENDASHKAEDRSY